MLSSINYFLKPPEPVYFRHLKYGWYKLVPAFWRLQRFFEGNKKRNFGLISQFSHGRKSVRIDTVTLYKLYNSKFTPKIPDAERMNRNLVWGKFFNFEKLESSSHEFSYSIHSDGTAVSVLMKRRKKEIKSEEQIEEELANHRRKIRNALENTEYDLIVGIDPGNRVMVAANTLFVHKNTERNTKISTATFRWATGQHDFKNLRHPITKSAIESKENDRKVFALRPAPNNTTVTSSRNNALSLDCARSTKKK